MVSRKYEKNICVYACIANYRDNVKMGNIFRIRETFNEKKPYKCDAFKYRKCSNQVLRTVFANRCEIQVFVTRLQ